MLIGTIAGIYRYPVKSMRGETLDSALITARGLKWDRGYALYDLVQRKAASAKNVSRFPGLLHFTARYPSEADQAQSLPAAQITFPDGRVIDSGDAQCTELLSSWFGQATAISAITDDESVRPVGGRYTMAGTYFDYAPLHVLTDTSLSSLAARMPQTNMALDRFRPNLLIRCVTAEAFPENSWTGRELWFGEHVRALVTDPCPRCAMPTMAQADLLSDPAILKAIAKTNTVHTPVLDSRQPCLGSYAFVVGEGAVHVGDQVRLD